MMIKNWLQSFAFLAFFILAVWAMLADLTRNRPVQLAKPDDGCYTVREKICDDNANKFSGVCFTKLTRTCGERQ